MNSIGCKAWKNKNAITVVFSAPSKTLCHKWQLATEGEYTHMICMPGISKEKIDEFLYNMLEECRWKIGGGISLSFVAVLLLQCL